jgi:2-polyprenyl-3-methyl-5-hydroxy-6-metoxy-1,4-benzoquinol methylase
MESCKICNEKLGKPFKIREMMLGTREEFEYAQCSHCDTIQIIEVPEDIENYYPTYYCSFQSQIPSLIRLPLFKRLFQNIRARRKYKRCNAEAYNWFRPLKILPSYKILDIGSGKGKLICDLFNLGFTNVQGTDKYIDHDYNYGHGVEVLKKDLIELPNNSYDLLMMHHVFEHMENPYEELSKCYDLLKGNGNLMIRIPIVGKAWEIYKQDWVQLDAPRHFFIHTIKSMQLLAEKTGFVINKIVYDSTAFQFYVSELYKRDIPMVNPVTQEYISWGDFFSEQEMINFESVAQGLNKEKQGDSAIFYLSKA